MQKIVVRRMHHRSAFSLTKVLYLCVNYTIRYGKLTVAEVGLHITGFLSIYKENI